MLLFECVVVALLFIAGEASSGNEYVPQKYLTWNYTQINPTCTGPGGGRNPCQDIRTCDFAIASFRIGGRPNVCAWVAKDVPKVCCGIPLVYGKELMQMIDAEKARKRECGRLFYSGDLSETENKFFEILNSLPPIDTSDPNSYDPPLDLHIEQMVSPVGGTRSRQGDFPWMVAIFRDSNFWCGGTLIDRVHVLSAAHCFVTRRKAPDPSRYMARIGNVRVDGGAPFAILDIKVHEGYDPTMHYNDIAILTLQKEILSPVIPHICLPPPQLNAKNLEGKNTTLLGWGDTSFGGVNTPFLHIVENLPVIPNAECDEKYQGITGSGLPRGITDDFICAGLSEGGKDACQQDSGGPLMYRNNPQNLPDYHQDVYWVLVGIVSFGYFCGEPGYPGVYTQVAHYMDWIVKNTADQ